MAATIVDMQTYRRDHMLEAQLRETIVAETHRKVLAMLKGKVIGSLIKDAQDFADAKVRMGEQVGRAAAHAAAWAIAQRDNDTTPPGAA